MKHTLRNRAEIFAYRNAVQVPRISSDWEWRNDWKDRINTLLQRFCFNYGEYTLHSPYITTKVNHSLSGGDRQ